MRVIKKLCRKVVVSADLNEKGKVLEPSWRIFITEVGTDIPEVRFSDFYVGGFV